MGGGKGESAPPNHGKLEIPIKSPVSLKLDTIFTP